MLGAPLSGSGVRRARFCPPAYALPSVQDPPTVEAAGGTEVHVYPRYACALKPEREPAEVLAELSPETQKICAGIDWDAVPKGETEVAWAWHVETGRVRRLPTAARRYTDLVQEDCEVPGTADLVVRENDRVRVIDWKTVRWDFDVNEHVQQLEFYALCAAREAGVSAVLVEIGVIPVEGGPIGWHRWMIGWADLLRIASEVRAAHAAVQASRAERAAYEAEHTAPWAPNVRTGRHCRYCRAFLACPAKQNAMRSLGVYKEGPLQRHEIGPALEAAKDAEGQAKAVRALVGEAVDMYGPLAVDDEYEVRRDNAGALRVLKAGKSGKSKAGRR